MGKIETVMKSAIVRLARKEVRAVCRPLGRDIRQLKRTVSQLRKTVGSMEKAVAAYTELARAQKSELRAPEEEVKAARFSPRLIRSLRKRLGLSQDQMALLVGVSSSAVAFWEQGRSKPADSNRAALVALRKRGKREVRELLKLKEAGQTRGEHKKITKRPTKKARKGTKTR